MIADRVLTGYAIWFHDAIYDPERPDNEARSADWALEALSANPDLAARVAGLIRQTKHHAEGAAGQDEAPFLDMDIAILGAPREDYCAYAAGVRAEYAHVDDSAFSGGRAAFLDAQLAHPRLFRTDFYEASPAETARANMR